MGSIPSTIKTLVPVLPSLAEISPYLESIDNSNQYSNFGPLVLELQSRIANYFHVPRSHVVTVDNATNGIIGALSTSEHKANLWSVPSWSFIATAQAAVHAGVNFEFCDVDNMNRAKFPEESMCIIDVLPFGAEGRNYDNLGMLQCVVIDAAASLQNLSNFSFPNVPTALVVSLHATKMIGCGEGGFVVFNEPNWASAFKRWCMFGIDSGRLPVSVGVNCKMSEYSAAVALAALDRMTHTIARWKELNSKAKELSSKLNLKYLSPLSPAQPSIYWNIELSSPELLLSWANHLGKCGIESRKWWPIAAHELTFLPKRAQRQNNFPVAEYKARTTLGLPLHLKLSDHDFYRISRALMAVAE